MPELIRDVATTIFSLWLACILNGPEMGFVIVLAATRPFVEFVNRYS
jgi:hypothetical protein